MAAEINSVLKRLVLFDSTVLIEIPAYWDRAKEGLPVLQRFLIAELLPFFLSGTLSPQLLMAGFLSLRPRA